MQIYVPLNRQVCIAHLHFQRRFGAIVYFPDRVYGIHGEDVDRALVVAYPATSYCVPYVMVSAVHMVIVRHYVLRL